MVALALRLGASRVEIAHVQYYGWALKNRAALMPSAEQVGAAAVTVEELRKRHHGQIVIDAVVPDYYARLAEALRRRLGPALAQRDAGRQGAAMPRRRVHSGPGILVGARAFARRHLERSRRLSTPFAAPHWMPEPCQSCARREMDFGGCRCQAFALTGDARATDPVCHLSPHHHLVEEQAAIRDEAAYEYRHL